MTAPLVDRVRGRVHREVVHRRYRRATTSGTTAAGHFSIRPLLGDLDLPSPSAALSATATRYATGWFDLLGSGWRPFASDSGIAWHADAISGYRWDPGMWHTELDITPVPGVDVKVPWELGRLQHLPQLALAHRHAAAGASDFDSPEFYRRAVEEHAVDFVTSNPPGFGVQWGCAMDAGIRVANILLALDILATAGASLSPAVEPVVAASVDAHARFILANLEWTRGARTNHYLADVCGLLWAAAHLDGHEEADSWLCLAARELQGETALQFDRDGAGREGSTSYHRLSAEMVVWTTAVLLAVPADRLRALRPQPADVADAPPAVRRRPLDPADAAVAPSHLRTIARMPGLTTAVTVDGVSVALIGDNDSGRFVKPAPAFADVAVRDVVARYENLDGYDLLPPDETYWWEDPTDHRHLGHAVAGLFGAPGGDVDGALVDAYVRRSRPVPRRAASVTVRVGSRRPPVPGGNETSIVPGGEDLLEGLQTAAFVRFGLYVWRSRRLFLAIRCGPVGTDGVGGHDHRDQLALELWIDGVPWFRDPGSVTYTRDPDLRNAYRSAGAHAVPAPADPEDWDRAGGLFTLGALASDGVPRWYAASGFVGQCDGVVRSVELLPDRIAVLDVAPAGTPGRTIVRSAVDAVRLIGRPVPYSPGYGWRERETPAGVSPVGEERPGP